MEVVTAPPDDILQLIQQVRLSLGSTEPNDRAVQVGQLAAKFEKLIATIKWKINF